MIEGQLPDCSSLKLSSLVYVRRRVSVDSVEKNTHIPK